MIHIVIISPDFWFSNETALEIKQTIPDIVFYKPEEVPDDLITVAIVDDSPNRNLQRYPNLKVVFSVSAGVDNLISESQITNIPIVRLISPTMVSLMTEYVLYHVIRLHRGMAEFERLQTEHKWDWFPPNKPLNEFTVSILGLGKLGLPCASALLNIGYHVVGWSRTQKSVLGIDCYSGWNGLMELLPKTNVLVCLLPLTTQTHNLLNKDIFYQLPKGASIINVSRGDCINQNDLLMALNDKWLSHAVLDVFPSEPLSPTSILWNHPRITITPHIAAYPEANSFINPLRENLIKLVNGETADSFYKPDLGY